MQLSLSLVDFFSPFCLKSQIGDLKLSGETFKCPFLISRNNKFSFLLLTLDRFFVMFDLLMLSRQSVFALDIHVSEFLLLSLSLLIGSSQHFKHEHDLPSFVNKFKKLLNREYSIVINKI
jgi:hypothetical protein